MMAVLATPVFAAGSADWDKAVAAAKKEGEVVVSALSGELLRLVLMSFEQDHPGIKVIYRHWILNVLPNISTYRTRSMRPRNYARSNWQRSFFPDRGLPICHCERSEAIRSRHLEIVSSPTAPRK